MRRGNIFWGVFFILMAAAIVAGQLNVFAEVGAARYIFAAPLAALAVYSAFKRLFFGVCLPLGIIVYLFRIPLGISQLGFWPMIGVATLLAIGLQILFGRAKMPGFHYRGSDHSEDWSEEFIESMDESDVHISASFNDSTKYLYSQNLRKVYIEASFSGMKVYFDQAKLDPEGCTVFISASISGLELYIPRDWRVVDQLNVSLGGIDEKNKSVRNIDGESPILTLTGEVSLGGIEIYYI